jgi:hypothetical protein
LGQFTAKIDRWGARACVLKRGKGFRREERGPGSPMASKSKERDDRYADSDEEFPQTRGVSGGGEKRGKGGDQGEFIGGVLGEGARV